MKRITIITLTIFSAVLLFSSCKKKHNCSCEITSKTVTVSYMSEYDIVEGTTKSSGSSKTELEESSNKVAKAACISFEKKDEEVISDGADYDSDGNTSEKAYTSTTTITGDCSID